MKCATPSEYTEQVAVVNWWRGIGCREYHLPQHLLFAIPNGGFRRPAEAVHLQKSGVVRGIPDLFFAVGWDGKHGLFVEMKRRRGGEVSDAQLDAIYHLAKYGYEAQVCYGADDAIAAIKQYLNKLSAQGWPGGTGAFEIGSNAYRGPQLWDEIGGEKK